MSFSAKSLVMLNVCFPAEKYSKTGGAVRKKPGKRAQKKVPGSCGRCPERLKNAGMGNMTDFMPERNGRKTPAAGVEGLSPARKNRDSARHWTGHNPGCSFRTFGNPAFYRRSAIAARPPIFPTPVFSGGNEKPLIRFPALPLMLKIAG
jgi:hypothetical protein